MCFPGLELVYLASVWMLIDREFWSAELSGLRYPDTPLLALLLEVSSFRSRAKNIPVLSPNLVFLLFSEDVTLLILRV
jgi:hypothetical protein